MAQAPRLPAGTYFARDYQVLALLAEGGMGAVYRVEQLSTRKTRALKLLHSKFLTDPKTRQRFIQEASVGASIASEHVVEVIGAGFDEQTDRAWIAMEFLDGADLGAVVHLHGTLTPGQLLGVMRQLCHGLAAAHRAGIVHRDLKPANVFVARSLRVGSPYTIKILDFGIAKVVQESGSVSGETDTVGSPLWMAPEQLNAQLPTPSTDVWSLGLLAFWALTGQHYWLAAHAEDSTVHSLFVEQLFKPLDTPSERVAELGLPIRLPDGFDDWFAHCTAREPKERFRDAAAAFASLEAILGEVVAESAAPLLPEGALPPHTDAVDQRTRVDASHKLARAQAETQQLPTSASQTPQGSLAIEPTLASTVSSVAGPSRTPAQRSSEPGSTVTRTSTSPLSVMLAVATVVSVVAGGGYLVWSRWLHADRSVRAVASTLQAEQVAEATTSSSPQASGGEDSTSSATSTPSATPEVTADFDDALLQLVVPLRTQLSFAATTVKFLGWTEVGHRFVLKVEHGKRNPSDGVANALELIQIHDALSGQMIESYLVERVAGDGIRSYDKLSRAADEARPYEQWAARQAELALVKPRSRRKSPQGGTVRVKAEPSPKPTQLRLSPNMAGIGFVWQGFDAPVPEVGTKTRGPYMQFLYRADSREWGLLEIRPPFNYGQLAERRIPDQPESMVKGRLGAYWSPRGERVVLVATGSPEPKQTDDPLSDGRWFLRAAGPQIRVVEAGAGQRTARKVALQLNAAGLTVALVDLREDPVSDSGLYYRTRRSGTKALADQIKTTLDGYAFATDLMIEPTRRKGWTDVVLVLGHDAQ